MGSPSQLRNLGHFVRVVPAVAIATKIDMGVLTAGAGLVVTTTGVTIDTMVNPGTTGALAAVALTRRPFSCVVAVPFKYGLASGGSWTVGGLVRHCSASGGTYTTLATLTNTVVSKVGSTTTTLFGALACAQASVDLQNLGAKRFIKIRTTVTANLTASGSSIERGMAVVVFNADQTPATATGARG